MSSTATHQTTPIFDGSNYPVWAIRMIAFLRGVNLWNVVEIETRVPALRDNATPAQVKQHEEDIAKKYRALSFIHSVVTEFVFNQIMGCETAKQAWDKLEEEFLGSGRNKQIRLQNHRRQYELLRMKDSQTVQEFIDAVIKIVNQIQLLGETLSDAKVKDISQLTISDLVNILEVDEQKRAARKNEKTDLAFTARIKVAALLFTQLDTYYHSKVKIGNGMYLDAVGRGIVGIQTPSGQSKMTWIYFLKFKHKAFKVFIKFKAKVENETSLKLKCLRTDNGGQFTSSQFEKYLEAEGIHHQLTIPYSP
ncbi:Uncharacterized protein TCM_031803 [Theobroma cacao]|uniref:Integrase catalytic domain-containing protein n=1 Tax=Theobroma cacao TaxID=3641 RepID=A0A061F7G3_THECC|nr:Uncharacterized protein TCM_031803 [Theobroma cacao]